MPIVPGLQGPTDFGGVYEPKFGPAASPGSRSQPMPTDAWDRERLRLEKAKRLAKKSQDWAAADEYQRQLEALEKFRGELGIFDTEQGRFTDALRRGFRTSTELTAARQQRGVERNVSQFFAQRGLSQSGLSGMGASVVQGQIAGETQQAQNQFENALNMSLNRERTGFIRGEFDFFHRLDAMGYQHELDLDMARVQAELQRDLQRAGMFERMLALGGQALSSLMPGVGPFGGMALGNQAGGYIGATTLTTMNPYGV